MKKKKILIVDDDPGILKMLQLMLRLEGYEALCCENALLVVETISREEPDLVLLDAMMPHRDGIQVLKDITARNLANRPPVLLFTGKADDNYIKQAIEAGASGLLVKPFVKEELLERLQALWSRG
jgi:two-component system, OmpR family, response regulator MtrA